MHMHEGELSVDVLLVRRLLAAQFPGWADLPLERVEPAGTDNAIFRLGSDLAVRVPRIEWASDTPAKEFEWLPKLAPRLPLAVPEPAALGRPGEGYPWPWLVCRWLHGETATPDHLSDPHRVTLDLAALLMALREIDPADGPQPEGRGGPLAPRDGRVRESIADLSDEIDAGRVTAVWESALRAPAWSGPRVWIHGDLDARNTVANGGRLAGVLDWSSMAVGDPACDVMVAWKMVPARERQTFRDVLSLDDATWERAKGWVVSQAVIALAYYTMDTNPTLVTECRRWLREVLNDGS